MNLWVSGWWIEIVLHRHRQRVQVNLAVGRWEVARLQARRRRQLPQRLVDSRRWRLEALSLTAARPQDAHSDQKGEQDTLDDNQLPRVVGGILMLFCVLVEHFKKGLQVEWNSIFFSRHQHFCSIPVVLIAEGRDTFR